MIHPGRTIACDREKAQQSRENKRMQPTEGKFATAYIDHGTAPNNESYEYMIVMDATRSQLRALQRGQTGYSVLKHDSAAHIVKDDDSNARGYAIFDELEGEDDEYLAACDKEVMVMIQPKGNRVHLSVCDLDLPGRIQVYHRAGVPAGYQTTYPERTVQAGHRNRSPRPPGFGKQHDTVSHVPARHPGGVHARKTGKLTRSIPWKKGSVEKVTLKVISVNINKTKQYESIHDPFPRGRTNRLHGW